MYGVLALSSDRTWALLHVAWDWDNAMNPRASEQTGTWQCDGRFVMLVHEDSQYWAEYRTHDRAVTHPSRLGVEALVFEATNDQTLFWTRRTFWRQTGDP